MNEHGKSLAEIKINPTTLVELLGLLNKRQVNPATAKEILAEMGLALGMKHDNFPSREEIERRRKEQE